MRDKSRCLAAVLLERSGMTTDQLCALNTEIQSLRDALVGSAWVGSAVTGGAGGDR